uniref:Methyltransferase n=1 Tax=Erysiphe necator associated polymycovirus 8 TaxID=2742562 RepID=A0A8E4CYS8_9VIRU|nr:methyltransferase [Erysiphe necator associated polymycovirus 8]
MRRNKPVSTRGRTVEPTQATYARRPRRDEILSNTSWSSSSRVSGNQRAISERTLKAGPEGEEPELDLYEYGDPMAHSRYSSRDNQYAHVRWRYEISTEDADGLREATRQDNDLMYKTIKALTMISGSRVLLLASGSSSFVTRVARLGPSVLEVVDVSEAVCARVSAMVAAADVDVTTEVRVIKDDALAHVMASGDYFDLIVCTHAIGQICKDELMVSTLITECVDRLAPGGLLVCDHHVGFTSRRDTPMKEIQDDRIRYLASGCGKFVDDINYELPGVLEGCVRRATWASPGGSRYLQQWEYFAWEKISVDDRGKAVIVEPLSYKGLGSVSDIGDNDDPSVFDLLYPSSARGVKLPLVGGDESSILPQNMMPKIDGEAAVVMLSEEVCTFVTALHTGTFTVDSYFPDMVMATGELVRTSAKTYIIVLTGLMSIGDKRTDVMSGHWLNWLYDNTVGLVSAGIICNTPGFVPHVNGNVLSLPKAPNGRSIPVDGINVKVGDRWNRFFKPTSTLSIDTTKAATAAMFGSLRRTASLVSLRETREFADGMSADSAHMVSEYGIAISGHRVSMRLIRERPDKRSPDDVGKMNLFMMAVSFAKNGPPVVRVSDLVKFAGVG